MNRIIRLFSFFIGLIIISSSSCFFINAITIIDDENVQYYHSIFSRKTCEVLFDTNNDSRTNARDVIYLMKYIVQNKNADESVILDINDDGSINAKDVVDLMKYVVSLCGFADSLSVELFEKIKSDFLSYKKISRENEKDLYIVRYYGEYDGAVLVYFWGGFIVNLEVIDETIAGYQFHYNDGNRICVWKNGLFYSLREAYENGTLNEDHVSIVAKIHANRKYVTIPNPYGKR